MNEWNYPAPIFSTRKSNREEVFTVTVPTWIALMLAIIILLNILLWGGIGLWKAGEVIFG